MVCVVCELASKSNEAADMSSFSKRRTDHKIVLQAEHCGYYNKGSKMNRSCGEGESTSITSYWLVFHWFPHWFPLDQTSLYFLITLNRAPSAIPLKCKSYSNETTFIIIINVS